ncbi:spexin prohormone 2-like [Labrus mixtus]|uniref:spexin prohormone 2-like n=1 Tax=Labrus mixtus TaxID=508554 RepID=UPI0029C00A18|nr:spexin prohormone 2-like [Labrus mixtus]
MKINLTAVWMCSLFISLLVESDHAQKLNVHWGPQSMMYLKGKHGRRFVSEDDNDVLQGLQGLHSLQGLQGLHSLQGWYAVLKGIQRLQSRVFSKPRHILTSEKVLIQVLQQR